MNSRQFALLEAAIQRWADQACEANDGPFVIWGENTITHMTKAAAAVLNASEESQAYGRREGMFT